MHRCLRVVISYYSVINGLALLNSRHPSLVLYKMRTWVPSAFSLRYGRLGRRMYRNRQSKYRSCCVFFMMLCTYLTHVGRIWTADRTHVQSPTTCQYHMSIRIFCCTAQLGLFNSYYSPPRTVIVISGTGLWDGTTALFSVSTTENNTPACIMKYWSYCFATGLHWP